MKKVISIMLALCLCLVCFVGCGNKYKGWEDQTLGDISYKSSPEWEEYAPLMESHSYYLTQNSDDSKNRYKEEVILTIWYFDDTSVDDLLNVMKYSEVRTNYKELEKRKIDGQDAYHFTDQRTDREDLEDVYLFPISDDSCGRILIYRSPNVKDDYNKVSIELFLDSIQINK